MDNDIRLRTWVRGSDSDVRSGLLGYVSVFYGDFILDGVTVRRTAEGRMTLSFPQRRDGRGRSHPLFRPIDDAARLRIEKAIFGAAALAQTTQLEGFKP
jgi:DNA-binding cell septation regulator SpoVG